MIGAATVIPAGIFSLLWLTTLFAQPSQETRIGASIIERQTNIHAWHKAHVIVADIQIVGPLSRNDIDDSTEEVEPAARTSRRSL